MPLVLGLSYYNVAKEPMCICICIDIHAISWQIEQCTESLACISDFDYFKVFT